ncbi:MAG: hypothetical protein RIS56_1751, partial [Verrucomicrobiota bacterium]
MAPPVRRTPPPSARHNPLSGRPAAMGTSVTPTSRNRSNPVGLGRAPQLPAPSGGINLGPRQSSPNLQASANNRRDASFSGRDGPWLSPGFGHGTSEQLLPADPVDSDSLDALLGMGMPESDQFMDMDWAPSGNEPPMLIDGLQSAQFQLSSPNFLSQQVIPGSAHFSGQGGTAPAASSPLALLSPVRTGFAPSAAGSNAVAPAPSDPVAASVVHAAGLVTERGTLGGAEVGPASMRQLQRLVRNCAD